VLIYTICVKSPKPVFLLRIQAALAIKISLLGAALILNTTKVLLLQLWRRLKGRHESSGVELPRFRREPPQFNHGAPFLPTSIN